MHILIQAADDVPIYRQIVRQVLEALASGRLATGEKMPSQRDLAQQLVVSPLTVKKAYDELERSGVLETRRGQGTFVAVQAGGEAKSSEPMATRIARLKPQVRRLLVEAWAAQIPVGKLVDALRREARELEGVRSKQRGAPVKKHPKTRKRHGKRHD